MKKTRDFKGNSMIDFPSSYAVIDIETTGLSPQFNEIIELAVIKVCDGEIVEQFSSLIQPAPQDDGTFLPPFIIDLTGITDEMLVSAPKIVDVLPKYLELLGDLPLVGHNINFDINFLYDNAEKFLSRPLTNDYVDTMRLSRRLHPELESHRLLDLAYLYTANYMNAHRALVDCTVTEKCYRGLHKDALEQYGSVESFINECKKKYYGLRVSDITASTTEIDPENPLYGKIFVFTGALERMTRREAMQIVVNRGGINGSSVTKKTNYLVLGNNDYCLSMTCEKTSKQKKAEKLILDGYDVNIIPENVFYDMISND